MVFLVNNTYLGISTWTWKELSSNVNKRIVEKNGVRLACFMFSYFSNCCICNSGSGQMCAIKEVRVASDDQTSRECLKQLNQVICLLVYLFPSIFTF